MVTILVTTSAVLAIVRCSLAIPLELNANSTFGGLSASTLIVDQPFLLPYPSTIFPLSVTSRIDEGPTTRTLPIFEPPLTVTITNPPLTTTEFITLPPSTVTEIVTPPETSSLATPTTWSAPPHITDLSSFNVLSFPSGKHNLKIASDLPPSARLSSPYISSTSGILQLKYPAHSINPAQSPTGGAEFYARPIPLAGAANVSLQYSVFFPPDFDWVKGGKLPGLYGGHTGCSGGNEAQDCFSTRLMWRQEGAGELYLYAPKTHQSPALCASPDSTCNPEYGFSIGRGSFAWARGAWTTVVQTVVLNTPGQTDGWFLLDVDGRRVIERKDVLYRKGGSRNSGTVPSRPTHTQTRTGSHPTPTKTSGGGLLGGILDPLLGGHQILLPIENLLAIVKEKDPKEVDAGAVDQSQRLFAFDVRNGGGSGRQLLPREDLLDISVDSPLHSDDDGDESRVELVPLGVGLDDRERSRPKQPIGFAGIFFSTFFGGHDEGWQTPKDQYVWFKDFALAINK